MRTIDATQGIRILDSRATASLLSKVLFITTVGFVFTAAGAYVAPALGGVGYVGLFILTFGLIFAINFASKRSPALALVLFYVFTFLMGVEVGPLIKQYLHLPGGSSIVFQAAATTAGGMFVMGIVAQFARFDYRKVYSYVFVALIGLMIMGVLSFFVHWVSPGLYAWATLAIFRVLLLLDFMRLKDGALGLSPVQMALSIYLDALNIFIALRQIFGSGSGSRRDSGGWR